MNANTQGAFAATGPVGVGLIGDTEFCDLVSTRSRPLLEIASSLVTRHAHDVPLTRPLIGRLLLESGQMEALLDEYGARQNQHATQCDRQQSELLH